MINIFVRSLKAASNSSLSSVQFLAHLASPDENQAYVKCRAFEKYYLLYPLFGSTQLCGRKYYDEYFDSGQNFGVSE